MTFFVKYNIETVPIDYIDFKNNDYKISRPCMDEKLEKLKLSIQTSGLLDPPVLLKANGTYIIILGHNRLQILKELNTTSVPSFIVNDLDVKSYTNSILLKNYRKEIGTIGKTKFISILKKKLLLNENDFCTIAKNLNIPDEFLNDDLIKKIMTLPDDLKVYIDIKDVGFKVLKNILRLPNDAVEFLSRWALGLNIRINIFKGIVDHIFDIYKRDKNINSLMVLNLTSLKDKRKLEESLYREILKIRYPEYTNITFKVDNLISSLKRNRVEIDFPEFYERDEIGVILKINKREKIESFRERVNQIDIKSLKELLDLL